MINLLIGFMIIPAILGILIIVFSSIEFFKYLTYNLQRHYATKIQKRIDNELEEDHKNDEDKEPKKAVINTENKEEN